MSLRVRFAPARACAGLALLVSVAACGGGGGGGGGSGGGGGGGSGGTNAPPTFTTGSLAYTVACGLTSVSGQVQATDPNGDALTFGPTNPQPTQGTFTQAVNAQGQFTYRTNANCTAATDSFGVTVGDGRGGTATATVTITITPAVNQPPVLTASSLAVTTTVNTAVNGTVQATDPNGGDTLTFAFGLPANGTLSNTTAQGGYTYTPRTGFAGQDTFSVSVGDGRGGVAQGVVTVTVTAPAGVPTARDDVFRAAVAAGATTLELNVLANDLNAGATPVVNVTNVSLPGVTATFSGGRVQLANLPANFVGFVRFTYDVATAAGQPAASARAVAFVNTEAVRVAYLSGQAGATPDTPGAATEVWTHDFLSARRVAVVDQGQEIQYRTRAPGLVVAQNAPLTPFYAYLASGNGQRDRLFVGRFDQTAAPVRLPLPAGTNVNSYAISPNGLYVAVVTCTTANAPDPCTGSSAFGVYVFNAGDLGTLPAPAFTAAAGTVQGLDVSFGPASQHVYLAIIRQTFSGGGGGGNFARGAYVRLPVAQAAAPSGTPAWTAIFGDTGTNLVRGLRCITSRDESQHVCSGNPNATADRDFLYVVAPPAAPRQISHAPVADQSVDIRFAVNPQFTWAAYTTNSEQPNNFANRRLYVAGVAAGGAAAVAVDPAPGNTRQSIIPIGFSKDGTALAVRENLGGPLVTYVGRAATNWTLTPPVTPPAGTTTTQPAFAADSAFTYLLQGPTGGQRGELLRGAGTATPTRVDNLNGIFVFTPSSLGAPGGSIVDNGGVLAIQGISPTLGGTDSLVLANASTFQGAVTETPTGGRTLLLPFFAEYWSVQAARNAP